MNKILKRNLSIFLAFIAWFAILAQFYLMIENRVAPVPETVIRFFSFFTILTNLVVAVYFSIVAFKKQPVKPSALTAVTVYISNVGLVYQVLLRHIWQPTGLQMIVDELLHSINPLLVIFYWYLFEKKYAVEYKQIISWMIYPLVYLIYILIRGKFSGFYPYPFINVSEIGFSRTLLNSFFLLFLFYIISAAFVFIGKSLNRRNITEVIKPS